LGGTTRKKEKREEHHCQNAKSALRGNGVGTRGRPMRGLGEGYVTGGVGIRVETTTGVKNGSEGAKRAKQKGCNTSCVVKILWRKGSRNRSYGGDSIARRSTWVSEKETHHNN